jgi:glycosyltransferase involved in cell wall biosynthesis
MTKRIVFHMPLPIEDNPSSASGIRPRMMLNSFKELGYEIHLITGYVKERKKQFKLLTENIKNGIVYDFIYSESSTQPTALTEINHLPIAPNLEAKIFKFCKRNNIKIGLFYRDIHWVFPFYGEFLPKWQKYAAIYFYKRDLKTYEKYTDVLYLPSHKMADYIPNSEVFIIRELPPGHNLKKKIDSPIKEIKKVKLIYVGGFGAKYRLHELVKGLEGNDSVECAISTRKDNWELVKSEYSLGKNIKLLHKSGEDLTPLYDSANVSLLMVEPQEYWEFAVPFKLFEYIEKGLPIIASEGTLVAQFIEKHDLGWVIPYNANSLRELLNYLESNPAQIVLKTKTTRDAAMNFTWKKRAEKVIKDLT